MAVRGPGRRAIVDAADAERYVREGWWGTESLTDVLRRTASERPDDAAFVTESERLTWRGYDEAADGLAAVLIGAGFAPGDRVGVLLPDGPQAHVAFVACERAGVVVVGLGARAGDAEIRHLLERTGAVGLLTEPVHRGVDMSARVAALGLPVRHVLYPSTLPSPDAQAQAAIDERRLGPDELFLLNSTSGTTGLPKCVTQFQNRWVYFNHLARRAGDLSGADVFMSVIPAPFGFGLWTAHFTPALLGATCVVMPRFSVEGMLRLIERERVTVLACVSTQFIMMLNSPLLPDVDLSSLRVMFTGGETVPYERAVEFEERTGATVLQFFGSNESGAFSCTSLGDPAERRLKTAGRVIPEMQVRLFDDDGRDVTATGGPGQPGGRGPALCAGYWDDPAANSELYTPDGWLLMGDLVTLDDDGWLQVVGRKSDFIIRGGKNISAAQVETEVGSHPLVDLVAAVPVPDPVFGERVCTVVALRHGNVGAALSLDDVLGFLVARGTSKELFPEYLVLVDELPRSSGGKVAKGDVRRTVRELLGDVSPGATVDRRG